MEINTGDGTGLRGVVREGFNCKMDVIEVSWRAAGDDCGRADG